MKRFPTEDSGIVLKKKVSLPASVSSGSEDSEDLPRNQTQCWVKVREILKGPRPEIFRLTEEKLPRLKDEEILVSALSWQLENYQLSNKFVSIGSVMIGPQLAMVMRSKNKTFPVGSIVSTLQGWRTKSVINPNFHFCRHLPTDYDRVPQRLFLGPLGLKGLMIYFGFMEICNPKKDNIVLINSCCGSTAQILGHLAKLTNCHPLLFVHSASGATYLRNLGFNNVYDFTNVTPRAYLKSAEMDNGKVDIYVDTVGKSFTENILQSFHPQTKFLMLGDAAAYRKSLEEEYVPDPYRFCSMIGSKFRSHSVFDFYEKFDLAEEHMLDLVIKGTFNFNVEPEIVRGFEKLPAALKHLETKTAPVIVTI